MKICKSQKELLLNVLHKRIIENSEIKNERTDGHTILGKQYLADQYKEDEHRYQVHHIDFDHFNNVLSNLAVVNQEEHMLCHHLYDKAFRYYYKNSRKYKNGGLCKFYKYIKNYPPEQCLECACFKKMKRDEEIRNS